MGQAKSAFVDSSGGLEYQRQNGGDPVEVTVRAFCEILAGVMELEIVAPESDFFDDLGADSLVMAHFCARVRKRDDLPSVSIREIYEHPTIAGLAASLISDSNFKSEAIGQPKVAELAPTRVEPLHKAKQSSIAICGIFQLLTIVGYSAVLSFSVAGGYSWVSSAPNFATLYVRSAVLGMALFVSLSILPVIVKWTLIGRFKPETFGVWGFRYYRFWLVRFVMTLNPIALFAGSPIYNFYLRAMGAKIGKGAVILAAAPPACPDLLSVGADAVVRKDSVFPCYSAHAGMIHTGRVTIGAGAFVGELAVLDIETSIGDRAQLGHASALQRGQSIPAGEHRIGSPAVQITEFDYREVTPVERGSKPRRVIYSAFQLFVVAALSTPLSVGIPLLIYRLPLTPASLLSGGTLDLGDSNIYLLALAVSAIVFFGFALVGLVITLTVPRLLGRAIKADGVYPLYGWQFAAQRGVTRYSNSKFFTKLLGDSSYIIYFLLWMGYRISPEGQTGANFGQEVKHDNPFFVNIDKGTMAADGLSIVNADYSSSSFKISPVHIGANSFLGNNIAYPSQATTGDNCLLGTKVRVPLEGEPRTGVGFLGSPSFEVPRLVQRDKEFHDRKSSSQLGEMLKAKNKHNRTTMVMFLGSRWLGVFAAVLYGWLAVSLYRQFGARTVPLLFGPILFLGALYNVFLERAVLRFGSLKPLYCSMYDVDAWMVERYWKMTYEARLFAGTPMRNVFMRLLGVNLGKRVFDDGCAFVDKTMITVGDDCTLNAGSVLQPHSQEDGSFKSDRIAIGSGCTLGVGAFVHYGVLMGDGSTLAADSFLMKGTEVAPNSQWGNNPADELATAQVALIPQTTLDQAAPGPNGNNQQEWRTDPVITETDLERNYWRDVLGSGGFVPIPRWSPDPVAGLGIYETVIDGGLIVKLSTLADELGVPLSSVFLAAHAKVMAVITGDPMVMTGFVPSEESEPLPCRLHVTDSSWRTLILSTGNVAAELGANSGYPIEAIRNELGLTGPSFETVLDPICSIDHTDTAALWLGVAQQDALLKLRVSHRTEVLDSACAARVAGYHVTALELIADDPDADHNASSLLSTQELEYQLDLLSGPHRDLPDERFHELFEKAVAKHPDAIAAECGDQQWTYSELNSRANRLARALLERGVRRETVVAVVTERNLNWMASVLAIFKAGAVYLPIEPHFPSDRIAATLDRASCKIVMTELGSTATLYGAYEELVGVKGFFIETAYREDHADHDLGITVGESQLAYIYFTSGSTGLPKGAMCEHNGLINHLYAKIDDFEIATGEIVAQIAPQCFDISLWQLISGLLVGGRTVLVEQDTLLDPKKFIGLITDSKVGVMQVVPSYLEVLLSYLDEYPAELPNLHCVSVTGEALTMELVDRWFSAQPNIKLANAYGLTETSDDTNHEVMSRPPADGKVPLGPAVNNVQVRVVGPDLSPVPLGAPGEIVFAGVCVGRGYINDPERTRAAFMTDPLDENRRFYRSGDYGRWRPDGKLEFLGRRDAQVKIRGFRIEIGDIENAMYRIPGVRQAAVIVTERNDGSKQLVGFFSANQVETDAVQNHLRESLPDYMVPSIMYNRDGLPLSDNGKINRKALAALADEMDQVINLDVDQPETPAEKRLALVWAKTLGVPVDQVDRYDNFFDSGGSSLSAVQLVIGLNSDVSLRQVTHTPVLADLAVSLTSAQDQEPELLNLMSGSAEGAGDALICFPYAGGNAVNFHALGRALRGTGVTVYAAELPGHDLAAAAEGFSSIDEIVDQVVIEIKNKGLTKVKLWGHSSGTAFALATAERLIESEISVERIFLGAQLLGSAPDRRSHMAKLDRSSNAEIAASLSANSGYGTRGDLDADQAEHIGSAYRHDCQEAHNYLLSRIDQPSPPKLPVPITVVVAADDPSVDGWEEHYSDWGLFTEQLELQQLAEGGHYFLRTHPEEAAAIVKNGRTSNVQIGDTSKGHVIDLGAGRGNSGGPRSEQPAGGTTSTVERVAPVGGRAPARQSISTRPANIELVAGRSPLLHAERAEAIPLWALENRALVRDLVGEHGSLMIRGLELSDAGDVAVIASRLFDDLTHTKEEFSSRTEYPDAVYSSSAWPANQPMCMHHELSYRWEFPGLMLFGCVEAPPEGGAIATADAAKVLKALPSDLVDRVEREGWMLTRAFNDEIGLSASEAFQTEDKAEIEQYCRDNLIETEWQSDGVLWTRQLRSPVVRHPASGELCWFNQIAFLSEWTMVPEVRDFLVDMYGAEGLPFNTRFGNGDPIGPEIVQMINDTYDAHTERQPLESGDLFLVDNIQRAHSREPFEGDREVIVALGEPVLMKSVLPQRNPLF